LQIADFFNLKSETPYVDAGGIRKEKSDQAIGGGDVGNEQFESGINSE